MKKILKIARKPLFALIILFSVAGCSDFLDINTDPNNPLDSRLDQILPTVQTVIFEGLGNGSGGMSDLDLSIHSSNRSTRKFQLLLFRW